MHKLAASVAVLVLLGSPALLAAPSPENIGPYNLRVLTGGVGVTRPLQSAVLAADAPFSISGWVKPDSADGLILAIGESPETCRCLALEKGRPVFRMGDAAVAAADAIPPGTWTHLAVAFDGKRTTLYVNAKPVAAADARAPAAAGQIAVAPVVAGQPHFGGDLVQLTVDEKALRAADVANAYAARPEFDVVHMWKVGQGW